MNRRSIVSLSIFLLAAALPTAAFSGGFLKASGTKIVNDKGEEVILRGMGLGGWHVQEGYMFGMSGFANAAWEIRKKIVDVVGAANADSFYAAFRANFVTRRDMERLSQLGFNSVRMPMHYERFVSQSSADGWNEQGFVEMDSLLRWCGDNSMYLILDLHAAPGGQSDQNISDYNPAYPSLWQSEEARTLTVALWKKLAQRYANEPWIGGYDLLNETRWDFPSPGGNKPLRDLFTAITSAIRTVDTRHIVFIEGNQYANDFSLLTPPWDANMVYSFHKYWADFDIGKYTTMSATYDRPLWMGESGENSNAWFTGFIRTLENARVGWSWWTLKKFDAIAGPFSVPSTTEYTALLNYWKGSGPKPTPVAAMSALMGMADRLKLDRCTFRPDVIDAMLRAPFDNTLRPFAANTVPGKIYAVNYDMGNINVAYRDNDYQALSQGSAWNRGYVYRNDGVDIEKCYDLPTIGYDVGYTAANEFLNFTVAVAQTGRYRVSVRAAVNDAGTTIGTGWDNGMLASQVLTQTGGWTAWATQDLGMVDLTAGTHALKVFFYTGGCNLHYVDIAYVGPTAVASTVSAPAEFALSQNYPNPFNPSSLIRFSVNEAGPVTLTVTDVLGREAAVLVNERLDAGAYERTFSAGPGLMTGVYFYTLKSGGRSATKTMLLMK